jgi:hypothetical protein
MTDDLAPVAALLTDPELLSRWRRCVFSIGGRKVTAVPVGLRRGAAVKLVEPRGRREETTTIPASEWAVRVSGLLEGADRVHLLAPDGDWHARRTKRGRWLVSRGRPSLASNSLLQAPLPPHDRTRRHPLPADDPEARRLFVTTGLFSPEGRLRKPQAAKYRQVQHYLELLRPLPVWGEPGPVRVVDAGCGKAYMSLALCAWGRTQGSGVELVGVDANPEVVETVAGIAAELGYDAHFEATTIWDYAQAEDTEGADLLVSLHACDTATDEALAAGIVLGAEAIVLAPCCHHELARQLAPGDGWSAPVLRNGLLRGRFADILTDSLRATALEVLGYRAEVIEFVAAEHTAKNVMIRAVRRPPSDAAERARAEATAAYDALAERWGVEPTFRRLLADRWPQARASA